MSEGSGSGDEVEREDGSDEDQFEKAVSTYIDPLCPATLDCFRWYGWLLPPSLADLDAAAYEQGTPAVFRLAL